MDSKKEIVKKIVMARKRMAISKLSEETRICSNVVSHLQRQQLQLLRQMHLLNSVKASLILTRKNERVQSNFWETDCQQADETFFKNNFRMSRRCFHKLCELLPDLRKVNTNMREAIALEKRIAIALFALGSSAEYRKIAKMFGVGKTIVCRILLNFCAEVWRVLAPMYLNNFPLTKEKIAEFVEGFEQLCIPQCMGALDVCHIRIHPCNEDPTDYFNNGGWYSIALLALVDAKCRFIYVSSGSPGNCTDSQIFQASSLKQQLDQCVLLSDCKKSICGVDVPVFIIGDSGFRLSRKLMKPYPPEMLQSNQEKFFNYALSESHGVAQKTFRQLKARFRRIGRGIDNAIKNANTIILACCVLHNFLNENNDDVSENWLQAIEVIEANRRNPEHVVPLTDQANSAEEIRSAISEYLSTADITGDSEVASMDGDSDEICSVSDDDGDAAV